MGALVVHWPSLLLAASVLPTSTILEAASTVIQSPPFPSALAAIITSSLISPNPASIARASQIHHFASSAPSSSSHLNAVLARLPTPAPAQPAQGISGTALIVCVAEVSIPQRIVKHVQAMD